MKLTVKNKSLQIILTCDDPYEFDDLYFQVGQLLKNYESDHHYDEC